MLHILREEAVRSQRYVVISLAAVTEGYDPYAFILPFTVAAWKTIGWSSIVVVTGSNFEHHWVRLSLQSTVLKVDPRTVFIWLKCSAEQKISVSQVARLFLATAKWIFADDMILTSDVDLIPVSRLIYDMLAASKVMSVLNADCCGMIRVQGREVPMQPISNIVGTKRDWLSLMDIREGALSTNLINSWLSSHDFELLPNVAVVKGDNQHWYFDQRILSLRVSLANMNISKIYRDTSSDRIDRAIPKSWPTLLNASDFELKTDMHAWLPAFSGAGWDELSYAMSQVFTTSDQATLSEFRLKYIHSPRHSHNTKIVEENSRVYCTCLLVLLLLLLMMKFTRSRNSFVNKTRT